MPKNQTGPPLKTLPEARKPAEIDSPTLVLDVIALEDVPDAFRPRMSPDRRTLPEALRGMYYHG